MKKSLFAVGLIVVVIASVLVAGFAYAQGQDPATPAPWGRGRPGGMMGGRGMMGGGMMGNGAYGPMHTYMVAALADVLDLNADDVQTRMEAGETAWDIALSTELNEEDIPAVLQAAHTQALDAAVEAGVLTQEQADWMNAHMGGRWGNGSGAGPCHGGRGGRGMMGWGQDA